MALGVDIVVGNLTLKDQKEDTTLVERSLATQIYEKVNGYLNKDADVKQLAILNVGAGKAAVVILHV